MKTFIITTLLILPQLSFAIEPIRYEANYQQGRNGSTDTATVKCTMDVVLLHERNGGSKAGFVLWSDPYAKVSYKIFVPINDMPLPNGYSWTNPYTGAVTSYENGVLQSKSETQIFQLEISPNGYLPGKAIGLNKDGSGTFLECEF
ncbi:MAG: hypothetical protein M9962_07060 [Oligoflexia bacterium]|nr:hypothetical protein [Oligoflexia bacterium]